MAGSFHEGISMNQNDQRDTLKIGDFWHEPVAFRASVLKEGNCRANHKEGQVFEFDWCTPKGMCGESFVGMYPVLHSLRVFGDMRELGSPHRHIRVYNCPARVIQFEIAATYRCNLCGSELPIEDGEIQSRKLENPEQNLWVRVCSDCSEKYSKMRLVW
ncbi:MAG: hypothetical protein EAX95_11040 [Candidatus Thorarchaeota archaeon]|nr:hypothetical protein [Candidatus Thorarchaeota archaeon]